MAALGKSDLLAAKSGATFLTRTVALAALLFQVPDSLEHSAHHKRQRDCRVLKHLGKLATFFGRHELAPAHGFGIGAAAEAAPVNWFGTNAHPILVAFQRKLFIAAPGHEFSVHPELLGPITRNSAPNGENTHFLRRHHHMSEGFEVFEGIEAQYRALGLLPRVLIQREIEPKLGIGESGDKNRNIMFERGFEYAAALGVLCEEFTDALVELVTADHIRRIPLLENAVDDCFNMIEIGFGLERIIDAVVT